MQWQPISSVPKDGRFVRLKGGGDAGGTPVAPEVVAFWEADSCMAKEGEEGAFVYAFWDGAWYSAYVGATHWAEVG